MVVVGVGMGGVGRGIGLAPLPPSSLPPLLPATLPLPPPLPPGFGCDTGLVVGGTPTYFIMGTKKKKGMSIRGACDK